MDNRASVECSSKIASISQSNVISVSSPTWMCSASVCCWLVACCVLVCIFLSAVCVFLKWPSSVWLSVWMSFVLTFFCCCCCCFISVDISVMVSGVSASLPVHLGRSFGASLSWPVTLVTRWTSVPLISAQGRCWWASWTRTARDCAMITTTRTRWEKQARDEQPLTAEHDWWWPGLCL